MDREGHQWLNALLGETYFGACDIHVNLRKNERNVFCAKCYIAICQHCMPLHLKHALLQIRRYVYHDVIRLCDIEKLVDCNHVQCYIVNGAKVVFLNQRPQSRPAKSIGNTCQTCDRILQDGWRFCSLACKVNAAPRRAETTKDTKSFPNSHQCCYDGYEQLSPNCVCPQLTSPSVSPASSVSTADDDALLRGYLISQHAQISKCNSNILTNSKSSKAWTTSHEGIDSVTRVPKFGLASPPTVSSKSLSFASLPSTLKWARTFKWSTTSDSEKRLPSLASGELEVASTLSNESASQMTNPLTQGSVRRRHLLSDDISLGVRLCAQRIRKSQPAKRRKSTPSRSPIC
ncbi:hypothetical protein KP509_39G029500 [Ceratopteris richardii]|uniref:B box-type domain-containing protein n=1 Tax=Ceratopteris richardii TaxID=49495 RepID=A0A8T2Q0I0_CERRI|nr:hypothetical protein KP509_39G029500 [Ceratopteris richardii]